MFGNDDVLANRRDGWMDLARLPLKEALALDGIPDRGEKRLRVPISGNPGRKPTCTWMIVMPQSRARRSTCAARWVKPSWSPA
jgi:hypothetical protein